MTGRYPHNTGEASELHRPWAARLPTFPELLAAAGYYTAQAGKYHMSQHEQADGSTRLSRAFEREEKETRVPGNSGGHGHWMSVTRERPRDRPFLLWLAAIDAHRAWDGDEEWDAEAYVERIRRLLPGGLPSGSAQGAGTPAPRWGAREGNAGGPRAARLGVGASRAGRGGGYPVLAASSR